MQSRSPTHLCFDLFPDAVRAPLLDDAADATPLLLRPSRTLGKIQPVSLMLFHHSLYTVGHPSSGNAPAGEAPPRRAAAAIDLTAQTFLVPT